MSAFALHVSSCVARQGIARCYAAATIGPDHCTCSDEPEFSDTDREAMDESAFSFRQREIQDIFEEAQSLPVNHRNHNPWWFDDARVAAFGELRIIDPRGTLDRRWTGAGKPRAGRPRDGVRTFRARAPVGACRQCCLLLCTGDAGAAGGKFFCSESCKALHKFERGRAYSFARDPLEGSRRIIIPRPRPDHYQRHKLARNETRALELISAGLTPYAIAQQIGHHAYKSIRQLEKLGACERIDGKLAKALSADLLGRWVNVAASSERPVTSNERESCAMPDERRPWSIAEEEVLRSLHGIKPASAIADLLSRTEKSVRHRAVRLGLRTPTAWTPEEDEELRLHWAKTRSLPAIAKALNKNFIATYWRAKKLGLLQGVSNG